MAQPVWQLAWNDQLSVGIPEVDREHQNSILLLNALKLAIADRKARAERQRRMQLLLDDGKQHIPHEEDLFRQWHYPDADEHRQKHAKISQQLHDFMAVLHQASPEYGWIDAGLKIKEVWIGHLLNEDMQCRDFYRQLSVGR